MKMEKEIISREYIKPSSPTPVEFRIYNLSLLDQISVPMHVPLVMYFPAPLDYFSSNTLEFIISQTTQVLKHSLSEALTAFYPLAGRTRDVFSIDCNDQGVSFTVARIQGTLTDFLKNFNPAECRQHVPCEPIFDEPSPGSHVADIQVSYFDCGGIALASVFFHKVMDGVTVATFIKAWANSALSFTKSTTKTETKIDDHQFPDFKTKTLFPQNKAMQRESYLLSIHMQYLRMGKTVMRRYVFDSSAVSTLRGRITSGGDLNFRPSSVEAISALLWKCFNVALSHDAPNQGVVNSVVTHSVNLRRRASPSFPDNSFGNFVWIGAAAYHDIDDMTNDLKPLVSKMRNSVNKIDSNCVRSMQGEEGFCGYLKNVEETWKAYPDRAEYLNFTSWCNFGLYDVDFGWGKPIWISKCDAGHDTEGPYLNMVWLTDTRQGDGIEAWVTLNKKYIEAFESVEELQDLASVDPSPLDDAGGFDRQCTEVRG